MYYFHVKSKYYSYISFRILKKTCLRLLFYISFINEIKLIFFIYIFLLLQSLLVSDEIHL